MVARAAVRGACFDQACIVPTGPAIGSLPHVSVRA